MASWLLQDMHLTLAYPWLTNDSDFYRSLVQFIHQTNTYWQLAPTHHPTIYCDNKGLTINIAKHQQYVNSYYPNNTTQSEWDVLHEICATIHIMPTHPSINHIKGRQDRQTELSKLSLPAQLNVRAETSSARLRQLGMQSKKWTSGGVTRLFTK
jgi:hypothetical protein